MRARRAIRRGCGWSGCLPVLAGFMLTGCVSTDMRSFVDPDFREVTYQRIFVHPLAEELEVRELAERQMLRALHKKADVQAVPSLQILLPTREYTDEQVDELLRQQGVEAVLTIDQTEFYQELRYVPERYHTYTSGGMSGVVVRRPYGPRVYRTWHTHSFTTQTGGYYVARPRAKYELRLHDLKTKKTAWVATAFTRGGSDTDYKDMLESLSRKAAERLVRDGLVAPLPDD